MGQTVGAGAEDEEWTATTSECDGRDRSRSERCVVFTDRRYGSAAVGTIEIARRRFDAGAGQDERAAADQLGTLISASLLLSVFFIRTHMKYTCLTLEHCGRHEDGCSVLASLAGVVFE